MITYQVEKITDDFIEEVTPLLEEHYKDIAMYQDKIDLNPDWDTYKLIDGDGFVAITARDDEKLIGYTAYFIKNNLHYKDHIFAVNDVIYLDKEYRGGTTAVDMLMYTEEVLEDLGVSVATMHMKTFAPFETLMQCLSFDKAEFLYTKYIGK
jgi:GNAT superfamily N-acetyltransferase